MAHFSPEDVKKLKQIITEGIHITEEVNVLKEKINSHSNRNCRRT